MVSAELCRSSEYPEAAGEVDSSWSLGKSLAESGGVAASPSSLWFMVNKTEAASRSWTC